MPGRPAQTDYNPHRTETLDGKDKQQHYGEEYRRQPPGLFEDQSALNLYNLDPFRHTPKRRSAKERREDQEYQEELAKKDKLTKKDYEKISKRERKNGRMSSPLVNNTVINSILEQSWTVGGKQYKVKETLGVVGAFPRWIGIGNLTRNISHTGESGKKTKNETKFLSTMMIIGDSKLEVELNVADGFPKDVMDENEIMIPQDYADYLGFHEAPSETLRRTGKPQNVSLSFDLFGFVFNFKDNEKAR